MATGRPDFHPTMLLEGKYGNSLIPILTDALGQLYTVMSGYFGGVPTPILLDVAGRILAHLVGSDGGTIRDVTVDAAGNLIVQIKGDDSGTLRTVAVDAAGILLSRMKGSDGGTLRDIAVDGDGNMIAVVKGDDGGTLRTVAVDASGIMKANLSAQDLDFLRVRPVYGQLREEYDGAVAVPHATTTDLVSITGRGATIGGYFSCPAAVTENNLGFNMVVDGTSLLAADMLSLNEWGWNSDGQYPFYNAYRNPVTPKNVVGIGKGVTFESSFKIQVFQASGSSQNIEVRLTYALVPPT